ncbi:MAG: D-tyrosyl-tRNA(Tyr) deacylase [Deltaproteobacteria bacterium]|nr:D-tyrosyl-tRNA(Tyr) deacylase [Deltaproteobacteria bacterium]
MRILIQRVSEARVVVGGQTVGQIGLGLLALVGAARGDDEAVVGFLAEKMLGLRIFGDDQGKMNLSVGEIGGAILLVSQFTLLGDCRRGRRPSFAGAAEPALAECLFLSLGRRLEASVPVSYGRFGAHMAVSLVNDGPVTFMLEKVTASPGGDGQSPSS